MANATVTKAEPVPDPPELTLEDLPGLCRLCLKKNDVLSDLEPELREFYKRCIERPMEVKDELPSKICERCFSYLDCMDTFIRETSQNRKCKSELLKHGEGNSSPITIDGDDSLGVDDKENKTELKRKLGLVKADPDEQDVKPKKPKIESGDAIKEEEFEGRLQEEVVEIKDENGGSDEENEEELDEDEDVNEDELDDEDDEEEDVGVDSEEDEEDEDEEEGEEDSDE